MKSLIRSHWWGVMTETIWGAVSRTRKFTSALATLLALSACLSAHAAEVTTDSVAIGAARLAVRREPDAAECPGADAIAAALRPLGIDGASAAALEITVSIAPSGSGFAALVTVSGQNGGVRALRADGPGCARLSADLEATLALLLDQRQRTDAPPAPATSATPEVPPPAKPAAPPASPAPAKKPSPAKKSSPSALHGRAELGAGATIALVAHPTAYFDAAFWLEHRDFSAALQLFSTTSSNAELGPGGVHVLLMGGVLKGCLPVFGTLGRFEGSLCVAGAVAALRGEATGYVITEPAAYRPWYALGGAVVFGAPIARKFSWKADATLLAPLHHESFVVGPLGTAFETPFVGALVGARLGMSIW